MAQHFAKDDGPTSAATCDRCELDRTKDYQPDDKDYEKWRAQRMYAPCWSCIRKGPGGQGVAEWLSPTGCQSCVGHIRRRDHICLKCGLYLSRWGLLYYGDPQQATFKKYPAAWRIAYYAVHGAPSKHWRALAKAHLLDGANLHFVNTGRRELGLELEPEIEGGDARADFAEKHQYAEAKYIEPGTIRGLVASLTEKLTTPKNLTTKTYLCTECGSDIAAAGRCVACRQGAR